MSPDTTHLCDGCNVREPWEHRCHGNDGAWMGEPPCECPVTSSASGGGDDAEGRSRHAVLQVGWHRVRPVRRSGLPLRHLSPVRDWERDVIFACAVACLVVADVLLCWIAVVGSREARGGS